MLHYRWDIKQEAMLLIYNYERIELNKTDTLPKMVSVFYYHSGVFCLVDGVQFNTGSVFIIFLRCSKWRKLPRAVW